MCREVWCTTLCVLQFPACGSIAGCEKVHHSRSFLSLRQLLGKRSKCRAVLVRFTATR